MLTCLDREIHTQDDTFNVPLMMIYYITLNLVIKHISIIVLNLEDDEVLYGHFIKNF